jgi:NTE family protein
MGAIVGGLYAIGYSGKEIETIANTSDWDFLLSNQTYWSDIHINEKGEYGRYLMEMPMKSWKVSLPSGLIEGQNLMNYLRQLTFRVAHVRDFDHFKIPFKCMAADIVTGEPIVLDKGDLAMALRASMSIPSLFSPVDYGGDTLMVDGGVVHNFPVDLLCKMGADMVIGSYTGSRLYGKNQLQSMAKLLYQTTSLHTNAVSESQMLMCDILLNMDDPLSKNNLKSADFNKSSRIIAVGDSVANHALPALKALAEKQKKYAPLPHPRDSNLVKKGGALVSKNTTLQIEDPLFFVKKITLKGISDEKQDATLRYMGLSENKMLTRNDIQERVNFLYSSNLYKKVYFEFIGAPLEAELIIHAEPKTVNSFKFGLHYDNMLGSGIVVNFTARDILGYNSRLIVAADVAESPKLRVHYRKQLSKSNWSYNVSQVYESTKEPFYFNNQRLENYRRHQNIMGAFLSTPLSPSAEFGGGLTFNRLVHKPLYRVTDRIYLNNSTPDSISQLTNYRNITFAPYLYFKKNTLNNTFFPEKGYSINVQAKYGFANQSFTETKTYLNEINITKSATDTAIGDFLRISANFETVIPLSKKAAISTKINAGTLLGDTYINQGKLYGENFFFGGIEGRRSPNYIPFAGNREGATAYTTFATAQIGVQFQLLNNLFVMPHSSFLIGNDSQPIYSGGLTVGYRSSFLPFLLSIAKASNGTAWQPYFAIGYRF